MIHAGIQYRNDALKTTSVLCGAACVLAVLHIAVGHWATFVVAVLPWPVIVGCLAELLIMSYLSGHLDSYRSLFNRYLPLFNLLLPVKAAVLAPTGTGKRMISRHFFTFNNELVERALKDAGPGQVLLLLPHCMQFSGCRIDVVADVDNCKGCGKCQIGDLLTYKEKYGIPIRVCLRTRYALTHIVELKPELVIGVACESRLYKGVRGAKGLYRYLVETENDNDCCIDNSIMIEKVSGLLERLYGY